MEPRNLANELSKPELTMLSHIVLHTIGPHIMLQWNAIRNNFRDNPTQRGLIGLQGGSDNYLNVQISRILKRLIKKEYVTKHHLIEDDRTKTFYAVEDESVRNDVKTLWNFVEGGVAIHVKGVIPVPGFRVKDFNEFKEFVLGHYLFRLTLREAFHEYNVMWKNGNDTDLYPTTEKDVSK